MINIKTQENKKLAFQFNNTKDFFSKNKFSENTTFIYDPYNFSNMIIPQPEEEFHTLIEIQNQDVLDMAKLHVSYGLNPVILNFASKILPGGGVKRGASSQEEDIYRRTNLFQSVSKENCSYPLESIVYSSNLYVAKDTKGNFLQEPFSISCISAAAPRWPSILRIKGREVFHNRDDLDYVYNCIETFFKLAIINEHKSIILGAWGCGAYEGPRHQIAELFHDAIQKYKKYFCIIGFPILVRPQNKRDQENFLIFKKYLMR
jgi:uncharacterized protein (TIGR02452 family)